MKKLLSFILMLAMTISILTACEKANTASVVAKNLDNNLNTLSTTINKLDTVDNKYLSNPDIYSSIAKPEENKFVALAFNENEAISKESVKQILIDKITDKLLSQNEDCETGSCYTCDKYCDENGNCYYTDCKGNNYCYNNSGECFECDKIPESCKFIGQTTISCEDGECDTLDVQTLSIKEESNLNTESETKEIISIENLSEETNNNTLEEDLNSSNTPTISEDKTKDKLTTPNPRFYYFTQESFSPIKIKYSPRYINQYNEQTINDQIESYLLKVQKLYAMSEDSIEANTLLQKCKADIIECIDEIRELNINILNGTCEPSVQELQALSNYIVDIKNTTKRLKDCNGELTKEVSNISESNSNAMINSVDVMNSNYMRLLNHIDTRVTYHRSAIATLEQIKYLLDGAINNGKISEEELEEIIESFTIDEKVNEKVSDTNAIDNVSNVVDNDNTSEIYDNDFTVSDNISLYNENNANNNDSTNNEENNKSNTTNATTETNQSDNKIINNSQDTESYETIDNTTKETENTSEVFSDNINNLEENITEISDDFTEVDNQSYVENLDKNIKNDSIESENSNANTNENIIDTNSEEITEKNTNIDTYNTVSEWSNIDTYKSDNLNTDNKNIYEENTESLNNSQDNEKNIDTTNGTNNNVSTSQDLNEQSTEDLNNNDTLIDNALTDTNNNVLDTNGLNNRIVNNSNGYTNSIITQNNLNNNDGYGGYYYTADGEVKNNGVNNNNELGNNGNTIENNTNKNNNVNTYGYNTMLDIINQGTVNNGINTL